MFGSQYCTTHCHDAPVTVQGVTEEPPEPVNSNDKGVFEPQIRPQRSVQGNIVMLNGSLFFWTVKTGNLTIFKSSLYGIQKAIKTKDRKE